MLYSQRLFYDFLVTRMTHSLQILPDKQSSAAENMTYDFLMLQRYADPNAIRFRHYGWTERAYTFGLSQQYAYAVSELQNKDVELCRRPTGGGVVSHIEDWTYSIVIPATHPLCQGQPVDAYKGVHQCIVDTLKLQGVKAILNTVPPESQTPSVCFEKAELYDIVLENLPTKIAGAAQKRTKAGMLLQGSIWKPTISKTDWTRFQNDLIMNIASHLDASIEYVEWPHWYKSEVEKLNDQFDSDDWNQRR